MTAPNPGAKIASECIAVRLRLVNRVITSLYDEALRPLELKVTQLNLLVATSQLGLARPAEVCGVLQMDTSTLSRNLTTMRKNGWIEIVPQDDNREKPFRLTNKGQRLLQKALPLWEKAQAKASELLQSEGVAALDQAARNMGFSGEPTTP